MAPKRVSETSPVQVYLDRKEHARLERLAEQLETSKSDILRRGIRALERKLMDPEAHPAFQLIGLAEAECAAPLGYDVAREHDRFVAESEEAVWRVAKTSPRRRRGR